MELSLKELRQKLRSHANPAKAEVYKRFFKTGKGQYGHGDRFIGLTVPLQRSLAKQFVHLGLTDIDALLQSPIHEERLTALLILVAQYKKAPQRQRKVIFEFYLNRSARVNNWDLVDLSAYHIVGAHLEGQPHDILFKLARSKNLWKRRIAIVASFHNITRGKSEPTLILAAMLLKDKEELIHKAVGWMLREVGKRVGRDVLEDFLCRNYKHMPRVMLRYAIERLPLERRIAYLKAEL